MCGWIFNIVDLSDFYLQLLVLYVWYQISARLEIFNFAIKAMKTWKMFWDFIGFYWRKLWESGQILIYFLVKRSLYGWKNERTNILESLNKMLEFHVSESLNVIFNLRYLFNSSQSNIKWSAKYRYISNWSPVSINDLRQI